MVKHLVLVPIKVLSEDYCSLECRQMERTANGDFICHLNSMNGQYLVTSSNHVLRTIWCSRHDTVNNYIKQEAQK